MTIYTNENRVSKAPHRDSMGSCSVETPMRSIYTLGTSRDDEIDGGQFKNKKSQGNRTTPEPRYSTRVSPT